MTGSRSGMGSWSVYSGSARKVVGLLHPDSNRGEVSTPLAPCLDTSLNGFRGGRRSPSRSTGGSTSAGLGVLDVCTVESTVFQKRLHYFVDFYRSKRIH